MRVCLWIFRILGIFAFYGDLSAQEARSGIKFEHLGIPGNIRSAFVIDMLQDPEGLLWFGSSTGLYRYNGQDFTHFQYTLPDSIPLFGREINALHWDTALNRLLVGTRQYGLLSYSYHDDSLRSLARIRAPINDITQTQDGTVWVLSFTNKLYKLESDSAREIPVASLESPSALLSYGSDVIVGDLRKIVILKNGQIKRTLPMEWQGKKFASNARFTALMVDNRNRLWAGTERDGIFLYDYATGSPLHHIPPTQRPYYSRINAILQDDRGLVWVLTKAEGLAIFNPETRESRHLSRDFADQYSISGNNCTSILQDKSGIIWVGTNGDINKYDRTKFKFDHYHYDPHDPNSLSDNMVRTVFVDDEDQIWAGTDGGFMNIIDRKTDALRRIRVIPPGKSDAVIPFAFATLNGDEVLVGTSEGILIFNKPARSFRYYEPLKEIVAGRRVRQLLRVDNTLYCLMLGKVIVHDLVTKRSFMLKGFHPGAKPRPNASHVLVDKNKQLWISTIHNSIARYDALHDSTIHYPLAKDTTRFMILSVTERDNQFLVCTQNAGLLVLENRGDNLKIVRQLTQKDGLPDNTLYAVLPDREGNLWFSTNLGIARLGKDSTFTHFDITEGVQDEEFNRLAYGQTRGGELIFGGINGINVFNPSTFFASSNYIHAKVFGVTAHSTTSASDTKTYYSLIGKKKIELSFKQNFLLFDFGTTDYRTPFRNTFEYKLENFDQHWIDAGQRNFASYTGLDPGNYIFRLKVRGENGQESEAAVAVNIVPPFYRTWWFNVLAFLAACVIVVGIIQGRVQQDKLDKHRLEVMLNIRTQEIEKSRLELKSLNQKKDLIFSILSHDLRSPLTTLKGFLGVLIENSDVLSKEEIRKHSITIRNSVTNSLDLIDNTLFWSLSQMGNISYTPTRVSLNNILSKVKGLYQLTSEKKMIIFTIHVEEDLYVTGDENMIYVTVRNLISNALKYTPAGKQVTVSAHRKDDVAEIIVRDEGIGMSGDYLSKILSLDQPILKKGTSNEKGTGLGLLLCKNFIEQNQGTLLVTSTENVGTTFIVTFPLADPLSH